MQVGPWSPVPRKGARGGDEPFWPWRRASCSEAGADARRRWWFLGEARMRLSRILRWTFGLALAALMVNLVL
ncbi:MAG: hypothetical protein ABI589_12265, partial [Burkholderiales bacterium]